MWIAASARPPWLWWRTDSIRRHRQLHEKKQALSLLFLFGQPGGTRTPYPELRRFVLYPDELLADGDVRITMVPETGIEPVRPLFTKRRILSPMCLPISPLGRCESANYWRRDPESNWAPRICNPLHNRFAIAPKTVAKKGSASFPFSKLEREKSLELSTSTLARLRSTN